MGLLALLRKQRQKEREIRILILGLDNAGKTTIVKYINGENVLQVSPTLGFNISTLAFRGFTLNFWDIGGQKSIRSYWRNYFEQTEALVWVVDSADVSRLSECKAQLHSLLVEERLAGASLLVYANKQDIPNALTAETISEKLDLDSIKTHHWMVIGCSAAQGAQKIAPCDSMPFDAALGKNIIKGLDWLVQDVSSRIYMAD